MKVKKNLPVCSIAQLVAGVLMEADLKCSTFTSAQRERAHVLGGANCLP